jgi:hypothetical protein
MQVRLELEESHSFFVECAECALDDLDCRLTDDPAEAADEEISYWD